jgi:hypothetical protein
MLLTTLTISVPAENPSSIRIVMLMAVQTACSPICADGIGRDSLMTEAQSVHTPSAYNPQQVIASAGTGWLLNNVLHCRKAIRAIKIHVKTGVLVKSHR